MVDVSALKYSLMYYISQKDITWGEAHVLWHFEIAWTQYPAAHLNSSGKLFASGKKK